MKARFLALAALVLGMVSCQQDFADVQNIGGEVDFQLSVAATELGKTRAGEATDSYDSAYGAIDYLKATDWTEVDLRYTLEVFDANVDYSSEAVAPVKKRMVKVVDSYQPVNFDLRLVAGRDYRFVVFADFVEEDATAEPSIAMQAEIGKHHVIGADLRDIKVKNDGLNNEYTDAYFAAEDIKITNSELKSIELKRPYAKVRVVATDLHEINLNLNPATVEVKYDAYYPTQFNAVTGGIVVNKDEKSFTCVYTEAVSKYTAGYDAESFEDIDTKKPRYTHKTLFTDYILAKDDQDAISFTMNVFDQNGVSIKETKFNTDIPVQRNHLTTVIGNVLTTATEIEVTIDDNFENADREYYVFEAFVNVDGYEKGINDGVVTLDRDYVIGRPIYVKSGINAVLNLNGKTITNKKENNKATDVIIVEEGATLTINGEGTIEAVSGNDGYAVIAEGTVIINGGTFKAGVDENGAANAVVYARGNGEVYVKGGEFPNEANSKYVLNKKDADRNSTIIEVSGGRFYNFDPMNNAAEGEGTDFMASGYMTIEESENVYIVVEAIDYEIEGDTIKVYSANGLLKWSYESNVKNNNLNLEVMANISFPMYTVVQDDEHETYKFNKAERITITDGVPSGSNWMMVGTYSPKNFYNDRVINGNNKTISNITIKSATLITGFIGYNENSEIKNLTFNNMTIYSTGDYAAPLGYVDDGAYVYNVHTKNSHITGRDYVAGIAADALEHYDHLNKGLMNDVKAGTRVRRMPITTIEKCTVDANTTINGRTNIAGIAGQAYGCVVVNCESAATIEGDSNVGGIAGHAWGYRNNQPMFVINCNVNSGKVEGTENVGGIIGYTQADGGAGANNTCYIVGCYANTSINGTKYVGSVIGGEQTNTSTNATVYGCYAISSYAVIGHNNPVNGKDTNFSLASAADKTTDVVDKMNEGIKAYNDYAASYDFANHTYTDVYKYDPADCIYTDFALPTATLW